MGSLKFKEMHSIANLVTKIEGKKSQARRGDVLEILKIMLTDETEKQKAMSHDGVLSRLLRIAAADALYARANKK